MLAHVQNIHVSGADFPREEWVRDMGLALCRKCKNLEKEVEVKEEEVKKVDDVEEEEPKDEE